MAIVGFGFFIPFLTGFLVMFTILYIRNGSPSSLEGSGLKRSQFESLGMDEDGNNAEVRATKCLKELSKVKYDFERKVTEITRINAKLVVEQKESENLTRHVESLKQEIRTYKNKYKEAPSYLLLH